MSTTTLLTFEEFEKLPSEPGKMELLDGELIRLPPAFIKHMKIIHRLFALLTPIVDRAGSAVGLGHVYMETGYKMGPRNWLQPDVSVTHLNQPESDYIEGAPALAIEVISESNTSARMERKVRMYLGNGGIEVWVVYPQEQYVRVHRQGNTEEFREVLRSEIIPGLQIHLKEVFA